MGMDDHIAARQEEADHARNPQKSEAELLDISKDWTIIGRNGTATSFNDASLVYGGSTINPLGNNDPTGYWYQLRDTVKPGQTEPVLKDVPGLNK